MQYPTTTPHRPNGEPSDALAATVLGLGLMMITTIWWWYVMR
jgi:hypothetical protein